ncbi:hypothetical protein AA11_06050 [Salmonella enterica subsp. diarizonae]|nr:hypothetical protein [Salmonella enterica subsp. diarizonae]
MLTYNSLKCNHNEWLFSIMNMTNRAFSSKKLTELRMRQTDDRHYTFHGTCDDGYHHVNGLIARAVVTEDGVILRFNHAGQPDMPFNHINQVTKYLESLTGCRMRRR